MSQYIDAKDFRNDDDFKQMVRGKVAQLRLILNNTESALERDKEIQRLKKTKSAELASEELRRRALVRATQARMVTL
ncbi:hypothetical protein [Idiomarina abyssalis]|uniref:hypothetical protein n=1 Tax=Idiomarina abyssalis TaxID=86102 RepID=UPI003A94F363